MEGIRLEDLRRALETQDPAIVDLFVSLAGEYDTYPDEIPQGVITIWTYRQEITSWDFSQKTQEERRLFRLQAWEEMEDDDHPLPLPDRYSLHEPLLELARTEGSFARESLLAIIRQMPIRLGPWRGFKALFKEAETSGDLELYGALLARIDTELSNTYGNWGEVTRRTLAYLARRGWRRLRRLGESFPAAYVETTAAVLAEYDDRPNWHNTWVADKIFHQHYGWASHTPLEDGTDRAFADLWRESPAPLLSLLTRAHSGRVRDFAIACLKGDFRAELREISVEELLAIQAVSESRLHDFLIWLLENSPRFEQGRFRELGLHDAILDLLESPSTRARAYAARYADTHARDLSLERLLRLARNDDAEVFQLITNLLESRDPRTEIGLEAWGELLTTRLFQKAATAALETHFGSRDLTLEWFAPRLLSDHHAVLSFALRRFIEVHDPASVDPAFFLKLLYAEDLNQKTAAFALDALEKHDLKTLAARDLQLLLLRGFSSTRVFTWMQDDRVDPRTPGLTFLQALAFSPGWADTLAELGLSEEGPDWDKPLPWNQSGQVNQARRWLADRRYFSPKMLSFDWLVQLVESADGDARMWARSYLFEAFRPGDFVDPEDTLEGCALLWEMATGADTDDGPRGTFARDYLRQHHRPEDAAEAIPSEFLALERFLPALTDARIVVRSFAIELARHELNRWAPTLETLLPLSESRRSDLRDLIAEALLDEPTEDNARLLIPRESLSIDGVYAFCDSRDQGTRAIGLALIKKYGEFADPARLIALSDSPDRRVRAFVIRTLWSLYRDRGITADWEPRQGPGASSRPDRPPADEDYLRQLLRRILFAIPPARFPKDFERTAVDPAPVPARREKLYLLELMEELAIADRAFAVLITPLLAEFARSLGTSERSACLVSLARIEAQWPALRSLSLLTESAS